MSPKSAPCARTISVVGVEERALELAREPLRPMVDFPDGHEPDQRDVTSHRSALRLVKERGRRRRALRRRLSSVSSIESPPYFSRTGADQREAHHRLADDRGGRNDADVAAHDRCRRIGARVQVHRRQRLHQRRNRFDRDAHDDRLRRCSCRPRCRRRDCSSRTTFVTVEREDVVRLRARVRRRRRRRGRSRPP